MLLCIVLLFNIYISIFCGDNIDKLHSFCCRYITSKWSKILEAVIVASMSAVMAFLLMYTIPDCAPNKAHTQAGHGPQNVQVQGCNHSLIYLAMV